MTPNYVDSSPTGIVVSPWCSCRGSGNMEEECEKFLRDFTENPCLRKSCSVVPSPGTLAPSCPRGALEGCPGQTLLSPLEWLVISVGLIQYGCFLSHTTAVSWPASVYHWRL